MSPLKNQIALCCTFAMGLGTTHAYAQDAEPSANSSIAEVVVTATRRSESIQRTPMTIAAFSSDALLKSGAIDTRALQSQVPGLTFTSGNVGQTLVYLRGTGTSILGMAAGTSVATYVDGVYLSNQQQGLQKFSNIERVEVLKGPQATLYGRNATAGAINIITRSPSRTFAMDADASYGNFDAMTLRTTVTGPLSENVSALVSALYDTHSGYAENVTLGNHPSGLNKQVGVRTALRIEPADNLAVTLRADYAESQASDYIKDVNPGSFLYRQTGDFIADPWKIRNDIANRSESRDRGVSATVNADLGFGDLTSVTSLRQYNSGPHFTDLDSNDGPYLPAFNSISAIAGDTLRSRQFYHETYIATDNTRRLFATFGANYHSESGDQFVFRPVTALYSGTGSVAQTYNRSLRDATYSVFVDAGVNIVENLKATAGVRYSHDKKTYGQLNSFTYSGVPAGVLTGERTDDSVSPRFGVEYQVNPDLLLYVSATSGFKSGGFAENDPRNSFRPEEVWSYETGAKHTLWDGRARLNAALFYADYRNLQTQQIEAVTNIRRISNADKARIYGVDFEATVRPLDSLTLSLAGEYLHTRMGDASLCSPIAPCSGAVPPFNAGIQNPSGNPLPNAPKFSLTTGVDYEIPLATGKVQAHVDAAYRSRAYFSYFGIAELANGTEISQPSYVNLNAQLSYGQSNWTVDLYGQNLTDELVRTWQDAISVFSGTAPLSDNGTIVTTRFAPPRTYGVRVRYSF